MAAGEVIELEGRRLKLKNLDKVLYPAADFTKGELIDYYRDISTVLLPHLEGRPLTLRRFPDGVESDGFWEKRCPSYRPDWVHTVPVWSESNEEEISFCAANDLPTLLWVVNLATLELHVSLSKAERMARPTVLAFDLDPGPPADIVECCRVAADLRLLFEHIGLSSYPKTSGSKGLQVYVPLNNADVTYDDTKSFAKGVAQAFEERNPDHVVARMKRDLRKGKVFIDWSQNDDHKTTICVYSVRATPRPRVSTPVTWEEVTAALEADDANMLEFSPADVVARVAETGDLFAAVLSLEQQLPSAAALDA